MKNNNNALIIYINWFIYKREGKIVKARERSIAIIPAYYNWNAWGRRGLVFLLHFLNSANSKCYYFESFQREIKAGIAQLARACGC